MPVSQPPAMWVYPVAFPYLLHSCIIYFSVLFPLSFFPLNLALQPLLSKCSLIEPWDSLSGYVHLGIACLASLASDWAGAFWGSLSDLWLATSC